MLDLSESDRQIGEKLFILLNAEQQKGLIHYVLARNKQNSSYTSDLPFVLNASDLQSDYAKPLTEIWEGDLYFCLEERTVCISNREIELTAKEFDALHLLIVNRKRVLTFETIAYHVWGEEYIDVTPKTIHNLLSRLRQKLQIAPDTPEYIISVRGVGYKFDAGI